MEVGNDPTECMLIYTLFFCAFSRIKLLLLSGILAKVSKLNKFILISHKHKLIPQLTHIDISLSTGRIN